MKTKQTQLTEYALSTDQEFLIALNSSIENNMRELDDLLKEFNYRCHRKTIR